MEKRMKKCHKKQEVSFYNGYGIKTDPSLTELKCISTEHWKQIQRCALNQIELQQRRRKGDFRQASNSEPKAAAANPQQQPASKIESAPVNVEPVQATSNSSGSEEEDDFA